jgi:adenylate cyclase
MLGGVAVLRRLAAIGAADVPSYLRLQEADREGTLARLGSLRRNLFDPKFALHKGRTLEATGTVEPTPIAAA